MTHEFLVNIPKDCLREFFDGLGVTARINSAPFTTDQCISCAVQFPHHTTSVPLRVQIEDTAEATAFAILWADRVVHLLSPERIAQWWQAL